MKLHCALTSLLALGVLSTPTTAVAEPACQAPKPFTARYDSDIKKVISLSGAGEQRLVKLGEHQYRFTFDVTSSVADIKQSAILTWDPETCRIRTNEYEHRLESFLLPDRKTWFKRTADGAALSGKYKDDAFSVDSQPQYVDPLGVQIQMREDLRGGAETLTYEMVHRGRVVTDTYQVVDRETLTLGGVDYDTLKVEKVREQDSERKTFLWLAPALDYAMVKTSHYVSDSEHYEVKIDRFSFSDPI